MDWPMGPRLEVEGGVIIRLEATSDDSWGGGV